MKHQERTRKVFIPIITQKDNRYEYKSHCLPPLGFLVAFESHIAFDIF